VREARALNHQFASKRREFLLAAAAAVVAPHQVAAQPAKARRIGFLGSGSAAAMVQPIEALKAGLRELGYVEGKNITVEYRWGDGKPERLAEFAAELLRLKVELIVVWGTPAALAVKQASTAVPIVMVSVGDPVSTGLVAELARPRGNVTGMANLNETVIPKQVELLMQVLPGVNRVAILHNPNNPSLAPQLKSGEASARALGMQTQVIEARAANDLDSAFSRIVSGRAAAVLVLSDPLYFSERRRIAELATKHRVPTVFSRSEYVEAGGLMSYGASMSEQFRGGAKYVDKILRGANPAELPVEQASTFELVISLKTAQAVAARVPESLVLRADRVIR
jgi:putative ABC transport system substrate-binding protein